MIDVIKKFKEEVLWCYLGVDISVAGKYEQKPKQGPHVTMCYEPKYRSDEDICELILAYPLNLSVTLKGYGDNGRNEGILVDETVKSLAGSPSHITLSWVRGAYPTETVKLNFTSENKYGLPYGVPIPTTYNCVRRDGTVVPMREYYELLKESKTSH